MADVSHEIGSLRFVVDSPLSSKVAMFNNQAQQHKQSQLLNPFSNHEGGGRASPKPTFSKGEYGKPLAGSLTEARGQRANIHVMKEMLELCQIINSEGYPVKNEPAMRVIPFGELFNIYNYISDKVVGILLRARKHKYVDFEGEMLFQRRDDDVPVFLLRPVADIRHELDAKIEEIKRAASPAPQSTSLLLDKSAHEQKLKDLTVPAKTRSTKSRSQSPLVKAPDNTTTIAKAVTEAMSEVTTIAASTAPPIKYEAIAKAPQDSKPVELTIPEITTSAAREQTSDAEVPVVTALTAEVTAVSDLPAIVIDTAATTLPALEETLAGGAVGEAAHAKPAAVI